MTDTDVQKYLLDVVDVRSVRACDFDANPLLFVRPPGFIGDLRVADDRIRHRNLDVIASQDACAPQPDVRDLPALARIEHDEVANLVRAICQNEHAGEEVGHRVLGAKPHRNTDNTCRSQPRGDIQTPDEKKKVRGRAQEQHVGDVSKQRQGACIDEYEPVLMHRQRLEGEPTHPHRETDPREHGHGPKSAECDATNAPFQRQEVGRQRQSYKEHH